ncbi:hypothetical protein EVAR_2598_1 [Eumeta japonica]|uniref:Uncharacterized protein n=1 Tax=Eumeta variegata TaxID=151549 RepID=A0A4C1SMK4_EUMVA|nr:hypothetical protein EVAR_2598_1 [Eumeta japonica]
MTEVVIIEVRVWAIARVQTEWGSWEAEGDMTCRRSPDHAIVNLLEKCVFVVNGCRRRGLSTSDLESTTSKGFIPNSQSLSLQWKRLSWTFSAGRNLKRRNDSSETTVRSRAGGTCAEDVIQTCLPANRRYFAYANKENNSATEQSWLERLVRGTSQKGKFRYKLIIPQAFWACTTYVAEIPWGSE